MGAGGSRSCWRPPLGAAGLRLRLRLDESPAFTEAAARRETVSATLRRFWRPILVALGVTVVWTIGPYVVLVYAGTYLATQAGLTFGPALARAGACAHHLHGRGVGRGRRPVRSPHRPPRRVRAAAGAQHPGLPVAPDREHRADHPGQRVPAGTVGVVVGPAPTALAEMFEILVRVAEHSASGSTCRSRCSAAPRLSSRRPSSPRRGRCSPRPSTWRRGGREPGGVARGSAGDRGAAARALIASRPPTANVSGAAEDHGPIARSAGRVELRVEREGNQPGSTVRDTSSVTNASQYAGCRGSAAVRARAASSSSVAALDGKHLGSAAAP